MKIFFSYSHKDESLRDTLATHLVLLQRQGIITTWYDRDITAGTDWSDEILHHLNTSHLILLLVSSDFFASDYCWDIELQKALDRHQAKTARVIPIILRPCDWQTAPFGKLAAIPTAHSAGIKPVTRWKNQDEAFTQVAKGIRKAVEEMKQSQGNPHGEIEASLVPSTQPRSTIIQPIYHVNQVGNLNTGNVTIHGDQIGSRHSCENPKIDNTLTSFCGCVNWIYKKSNYVGLRGLDQPHRQILETAIEKARTDRTGSLKFERAELDILELAAHYSFYCLEKRNSPKFGKLPKKDYHAHIRAIIDSNSKIRCGEICLSSLVEANDPVSKLVAKLE